MSNVVMPQRNNASQDLFTIGGAVVGGIYGGPSGAITGAQTGQQAAGVLGSKNQAGAVQTKTSAIDRRIQTMQPAESDPYQDLVAAEKAVQQLPAEQQQQYGPAIRRARMLEEQNRGIG